MKETILEDRGQAVDMLKKNSSVIGGLERPWLAPPRPCGTASLMAEQLKFEQVERGAV